MDIDSIPPGVDFTEYIDRNIKQSDLVLLIIGRHWTGGFELAACRIQQDDDPVRLEVERAILYNAPIWPLLVDGATMPSSTDLPQSIRQITKQNASYVSSGVDFDSQMDRLIEKIRNTYGGRARQAATISPIVVLAIVSASIAAIRFGANEQPDTECVWMKWVFTRQTIKQTTSTSLLITTQIALLGSIGC
jgi:hypothetical protein